MTLHCGMHLGDGGILELGKGIKFLDCVVGPIKQSKQLNHLGILVIQAAASSFGFDQGCNGCLHRVHALQQSLDALLAKLEVILSRQVVEGINGHFGDCGARITAQLLDVGDRSIGVCIRRDSGLGHKCGCSPLEDLRQLGDDVLLSLVI